MTYWFRCLFLVLVYSLTAGCCCWCLVLFCWWFYFVSFCCGSGCFGFVGFCGFWVASWLIVIYLWCLGIRLLCNFCVGYNLQDWVVLNWVCVVLVMLCVLFVVCFVYLANSVVDDTRVVLDIDFDCCLSCLCLSCLIVCCGVCVWFSGLVFICLLVVCFECWRWLCGL